MLKNEKFKKWMLYLFIGFMIIQPLFDIYWLYSDDIIAIFKFSPSTILRMLIMLILAITTFIWWKDKRKYKFIIIAAIVYLIYGVFHHLNSLSFYVEPGNFGDYSLLKEGFYIIRMIMPLLIIFITYDKNLSFKYFKTIIISVALIFGITMVFTNFAGIALASYGGHMHTIKANFFHWFYGNIYDKYQYLDIASKGIFHMANQISGILVCLLPIIIFIYLKESNILHGITLVLTILSMMMLGTRVASMGWLAISIVMLVLYLFFIFIKKEISLNKKGLAIFIVIILTFTIILPYSPVMNRTYINDNDEIVEEDIENSNAKEDLKKFKKYITEQEKKDLTKEEEEALFKEKVKFVKRYHNTFGVDRTYSEIIYPYTEDPDFWLDEFEIPFVDRANHRQLKKDVTKRIIELNDNKVDYIVGMSFTRLRNAPCYMENDIFVHVYSIGVIGIILFILPYFIILVYSIYNVLKNYKEKFTFMNATLIFSIMLVFVAGMFSGNVFDEWICTLYLGFICGTLLLSLNKKKEK